MLSKIKASPVTAETRSSISRTSQTSDIIDEDIDNDSNNNNNNNINNNQQSKKTQDELLDIIEVSRKRRLSKDSADSLTSFIRWSFSHISDTSIKSQVNLNNNNNKYESKNNNNDDLASETHLDDDNILDDEDNWSSLANHHQQFSATNRFQAQQEQQQMLLRRQQVKQQLGLAGGGGSSSAANLALMIKNSVDSRQSLYQQQGSRNQNNKRARANDYSPERESKFDHSPPAGGMTRKTSNHLGNVVERLHQQQQRQQQQQTIKQEQQQDQEAGSNAGLSFHLQQFLQQQTSLEDLCSSVGLDDSNQLVLAAAIHRALVDSMGPNQMGDAKSIASSTGSSSGGSGSSNATVNNNNNNSSGAALNSQANLQLVDSMNRQQQARAYNTRAALHGLTGSSTGATNRQSQQAASAMNMSNRAQQQRHAQAAAALSALASAGTHPASHQNPMVDFECDTCGSSFDDRHRLMQHQSIHLELKKDWFTETPVDEVMKIFNRRRGEFLCNTCNLRFEATFDYDKHNHSVHGQRPYCCQFCGNGTRTFRFWRQYLNHLYDHRYIFSCTIDDCDFTVNRRDSLRFHIFRFHLNCQLPLNQLQGLRSGHNMLLGANSCDSKWPTVDDDELDNENDMSVGE